MKSLIEHVYVELKDLFSIGYAYPHWETTFLNVHVYYSI